MFKNYFNRVLTEIKIDDINFRVTKSPFEIDGVILWFCYESKGSAYDILGSFNCFDKVKILKFITSYVTSSQLRKKVATKRFEKWLNVMTLQDIQKLDKTEGWSKIEVSRAIFNLGEIFEEDDLKMRRRLLAKRFHPDYGGNYKYMALINDAFDCLTNISKGRKYSS